MYRIYNNGEAGFTIPWNCGGLPDVVYIICESLTKVNLDAELAAGKIYAYDTNKTNWRLVRNNSGMIEETMLRSTDVAQEAESVSYTFVQPWLKNSVPYLIIAYTEK